MNDDEIIAALGRASHSYSPVEVAEVLGESREGGLTHSAMVFHFKRAFPMVPLRVLLEAGGWNRLSGGDLSDEQFNGLLGAWIGSD
jgi:hypothetical protein